MSIQRYKLQCDAELGAYRERDKDGDYVFFSDHAAEVERLTAERDALKEEVSFFMSKYLANDMKDRIGNHIASLLSYTLIVQGIPNNMTNAETLREGVEEWRKARENVSGEDISMVRQYLAERDAAVARADAFHAALVKARPCETCNGSKQIVSKRSQEIETCPECNGYGFDLAVLAIKEPTNEAD